VFETLSIICSCVVVREFSALVYRIKTVRYAILLCFLDKDGSRSLNSRQSSCLVCNCIYHVPLDSTRERKISLPQCNISHSIDAQKFFKFLKFVGFIHETHSLHSCVILWAKLSSRKSWNQKRLLLEYQSQKIQSGSAEQKSGLWSPIINFHPSHCPQSILQPTDRGEGCYYTKWSLLDFASEFVASRCSCL